MSSPSRQVTPALLREWGLPDPGDSKKERGQVVVIGGSRSSPGGAILAGEAALRVGAGRIVLAVPRSIDAHIGIAIAEAGIYALPDVATDPFDGKLRDHVTSADAVLVGPGFDDADETRATLVAVADVRPKLLVLDAFALGVLADLDRSALPADIILNPNKEEAGILLGRDLAEDAAPDLLEIARHFDAVVNCYGHVVQPRRSLLAHRRGRSRSRHRRERGRLGGRDRGVRLPRPRTREGGGLGGVGARDRRRSAHATDGHRLPGTRACD